MAFPPPAAAPPASCARAVRERALELGFDAVGIAAIAPLEAAERYEAWLAAGRHGGMRWLASLKHRQRRANPALILKDVRSVVCVALCHSPARDAALDERAGRIARYAAGEDYHRVMRDKLRELQRDIMRLIPDSRALWYADTGAILERAWAERAGLGWTGKHSGLLSRSLGSWFLIGEVLVDRELEPDRAPHQPVQEHCGSCTRCIDVCPTRAIVAPYQLDARLCISYLTIEQRGPIPAELRESIGDWIFGCDLCQEACPWNRFAPPAREARLHARTLDGWTLERFLSLDEAAFATLFDKSPVRRAGRSGFLRNVCVALGNRGRPESVDALATTLAHEPEPLVRAHAAWALGRIAQRTPGGFAPHAPGPPALEERAAPGPDAGDQACGRAMHELERACERDEDAAVRDEAREALARLRLTFSRAVCPPPTPVRRP